MHIKQVIIKNFKSYRNHTVLEPFDKGHNIIVGKNGSGKTNLFYAIQFVVSDDLKNLKGFQLEGLLHSNKNKSFESKNGFVEIIFDNSDKKIPVSESAVSVKRQFNATKDEYLLNNKVVTRSYVMTILEAAGFINHNPFYIVKQGQINSLANASNANRMELLKEIAGVTGFEKKMEKCQVLQKSIEQKLNNIRTSIQDLKNQLEVLEAEQTDLCQYQRYEKIRRTLELLIQEANLNEYLTKSEKLKLMNSEANSEMKLLAEQLYLVKKESETILALMQQKKLESVSLREERDSCNRSSQRLAKEKTRLELVVKDLKAEMDDDIKNKGRTEKELETLNEMIREKEAELEEINSRYEALNVVTEGHSRVVKLKEQERNELYGKQNRGNQFSSVEERNNWLSNKIELLSVKVGFKRDDEDRLEENIKDIADKKTSVEEMILKCAKKMKHQRDAIEEFNEKSRALYKIKEQLLSKRNELWRLENIEQRQFALHNENLAIAKQDFRWKIGKSLQDGLDSVCKVLEDFKEAGGSQADILSAYHGTVISNFKCDPKYYSAVEAVAGNQLLHHIVNTDRVANKILQEINRLKLKGEVNFMPLNRLQVKDVSDRYHNHPNSIPMIDVLTFAPENERAFQFLFGRTLICRTSNDAVQISRSTGLNCVTLEGDKVSHLGVLTGGFINVSKLRLNINNVLSGHITHINESARNLETLKMDLGKTDNEITSTESQIQINEIEIIKFRGNFDQAVGKTKLLKEELAKLEELSIFQKKSLGEIQSTLETLEVAKRSLESEFNQDMLSQLCEADAKKLSSLNQELPDLHKIDKKNHNDLLKLEEEKNKCYNLLTNNFYRKRDQALVLLQEVSFNDNKQRFQAVQIELEAVIARSNDIAEKLTAIEKQLADNLETLNLQREKLEQWTDRKMETQENIKKCSDNLATFGLKKSLLDKNIMNTQEKLEEIGGVPSNDLYRQYSSMSTASLFKELKSVTDKLKKYGHVNKKAAEQVERCNNEIIVFLNQEKRITSEMIRGLEVLMKLNENKSLAITSTFDILFRRFDKIFKKLVPEGNGILVLQKDDTVDEQDDNYYVGLAVRVSFNKDAEQKELIQLSGGQKSLVALALIFAIQKSNPAPFYFLDEIDQALDESHRVAVAKLISELSNSSQFITTTFRPQLLKYADKFYSVKYGHNCSNIHCVTRKDALDLVQFS